MRIIKLCILIAHLIPGMSTVSAQDKMTISSNPFNDSTHINFNIAQSSKISLTVYNMIGDIVKEIYSDSFFAAGSYSTSFYRNFLPNGVYLIRLKIGSSNSITSKVIIASPVSGLINNSLPDKDIRIFPNPANTDITIMFMNKDNKSLRINIHDPAGKHVFTELHHGHQIKINISEFENGIYSIHIPDLNYCSRLGIFK